MKIEGIDTSEINRRFKNAMELSWDAHFDVRCGISVALLLLVQEVKSMQVLARTVLHHPEDLTEALKRHFEGVMYMAKDHFELTKTADGFPSTTYAYEDAINFDSWFRRRPTSPFPSQAALESMLAAHIGFLVGFTHPGESERPVTCLLKHAEMLSSFICNYPDLSEISDQAPELK